MKTKFSKLIFLCCLLTALLTFGASAVEVVDSGSCGTNVTWVLTDDGVLTISGTGAMGSHPWSSYKDMIFEVVITDGVTSIGSWAFSGCSSLTSVTIPGSVTSIGYSAFSSCSSLTSVTIPNSVTSIGNSAFEYCSSLTSVTIPNSVTSIGSFAFSDCSSLTSVTIPNSVTSIGNYAFSDCSSLTSVTIPNSVTSIGTDAFSSCSSLTSVTIPNSVTSIGNHAFSSCSSLTSVTIPNSVTSIGDWAFSYCDSLTSVTIPNSVTSIGTDAFSNCSSLTSVTIPNSVTSIGDWAFYRCTSLTTVTIPGSVTSIGDWAFYRCTSLTSVTIPGSVTSIGDYAFAGCNSLSDVYYSGTEHQWTSIAISTSGNTLLTSATIHYNSASYVPITSTETTNHDEYVFFIKDTSGNPISGVWVTYGDAADRTDGEGKVSFPKFSVGDSVVTVIYEGYRSYKNEHYTKKDQNYDIIVLHAIDEPTHELISVLYQKTKNGMPVSGETDLLIKTLRFSLSSRTSFTLSCKAENSDSILRYELYQGEKLIAPSGNGHFSFLSVDKFSDGGNVFIRVISNNGSFVDTPINLIFVEDKIQETSMLHLSGKKISFAVNDDIPFFGGSMFEFEFPERLPVEFLATEDKIHVGINYKIKDDDDDTPDFSEIKTILNKAKRIQKATFFDDIERMMQRRDFKGKLGPVDTKFAVIGYGEGTFDSNGIATVTVYVCLMAEAEATLQGPTVIVLVVPVTYSIAVSAEGTLSVEGKYDFNTATINADMKFSGEIGATPFGGVGVDEYSAIGVYGKGSVDFEYQLLGTSISPGLNYVDLTGELGLKAYLKWVYDYELAWYHRTWHLYTRTGATAVSIDSDETFGSSYISDLYNEDNYTISDLSYLENETQWMSGDFLDFANPTALTPLIEGTYRNAQPVLGAAGETPVLVFTRGNTERGTYNAPQLVYSVYSDGMWSEPAPVDSDTTGDSGAALFTSEDGTLWLIYHNESIAFADDAAVSLSDYAQASTVVTARFDTSARRFMDHTVLSTANTYASHAAITVVNGIPTAVWVENPNNDYFGMNSTNEVHYAQYISGAWTTAQCLANGLNAVTELAVGELNSSVSIAACVDTDNDLATADRVLYHLTLDGEKTALTSSGDIVAVQFAVLPGESISSLVWCKDSVMSHYNGTECAEVLANSALSGGFIILPDRLLYCAPVENGSVLYAQTFDGKSWNTPVQITTQEGYLQSYSAISCDGTTYLAVIRTDVTIDENGVEDDCDLCWTVLTDFVDIELLHTDLDQQLVQPGTEVPVTVLLQNNGTAVINEASVQIYDAEGTLLASQSFADLGILPGSNTEVELLLPFGSSLALAEYTVTVSTSGDRDHTNNTAVFSAGYGDLSVDAQFIRIGSSRKLMVRITNNGVSALGGTLNISVDGEAPKIAEISPLAPGSSSLLEIPVTSSLLNGAEENILTLTVVADGDEYAEYNNTTQIYATTLGAETFDMTYNANGGTGTLPGTFIVVSGSTITAADPGDLTNGGQPFNGWNTQPDGSGTTYQPGDIIIATSDITLYAMWKNVEQNGFVVDTNGVWWYYVNGAPATSYTGLVEYDGNYFYVENGMLNWDYTGLAYYAGIYFYVENGMLNWDYTGLAYYAGTYFYVENGMLNWDYTGLVCYAGTFFYVENGMLNWDYTGLAYYEGTYFYIENGMLNWSYTGLSYYAGIYFYVENGMLNWNYTGLAILDNNFFYIENGTLNWNYTGLAYYEGIYFYIENGMLNWSYYGLCNYAGVWFYIEGGMLTWNYNGSIVGPDGNVYEVVGSIVQAM